MELGPIKLVQGDSRDVLKAMPDCSVDSVVCDPPYALVSVVKRFGKEGAAPAKNNDVYARASAGFMGKSWDTGETSFAVEFWAEVFRVLKPGGHVVAFGGTRTYHRLACAIEDAGFEIRDQLGWVYGTGFPKSHDVARCIDRELGAERYKVRVDVSAGNMKNPPNLVGGVDKGGGRPWQQKALEVGYHEKDSADPVTDEAKAWAGWGTALKPAWEPIVLARKPLIGTVAANVLTHGTGALNIDANRIAASEKDIKAAAVPQPSFGSETGLVYGMKAGEGRNGEVHDMSAGRWPANILHDGSDEVVELFPGAGDKSAARFFYCPKASREDRGPGNKHPTVKPTDLMAWLCRLVTPPGGVVLDPFAGSGSTGKACFQEGFHFIGIEADPEYFNIASQRLFDVWMES